MIKLLIVYCAIFFGRNLHADSLVPYESTNNAGISKGERIDKVESHLNEIGKKINFISEKKMALFEKELALVKVQIGQEQSKKIETLLEQKMIQLRSELNNLFREEMRSLEQRLRNEMTKDYEEQKLLIQKLLERLAVLEKIMNDV